MRELTEEQKMVLIRAYEKLAGHTADWEEVEKAVADYVDNNGLPETPSHDILFGDKLDEYLLNHDLDFEDYAIILEL